MKQVPIRTEVIEVLERKTREVGWFPEVGVTSAYFHGDRKFHEGPTWGWSNDSVVEETYAEARRLCDAYQIGPDSSLELALFRSDLQVVKVRAERAYREWDHPENRRDLPANRLVSSYRIWSSKSGEAAPFDQWVHLTVQFVKAFAITGDNEAAADLSEHFRVELREVDKELLYQGVGLSNGQIANLSFENLPDGGNLGAGRFARLTGEIGIAVDRRADEAIRSSLPDLLEAGINVEAHPMSNAVHWDGRRFSFDSITWTVLDDGGIYRAR
jgi:hypothetical protein